MAWWNIKAYRNNLAKTRRAAAEAVAAAASVEEVETTPAVEEMHDHDGLGPHPVDEVHPEPELPKAPPVEEGSVEETPIFKKPRRKKSDPGTWNA